MASATYDPKPYTYPVWQLPFRLLLFILTLSPRIIWTLLARISPYRRHRLSLENDLRRVIVGTHVQNMHAIQNIPLQKYTPADSTPIKKSNFLAYIVPGNKGPLQNADVIVLYAHGGGYFFGNARGDYMRMFLSWQSQIRRNRSLGKPLDMRVVTVEYPLAPASRFPAQRDAFLAAYTHLIHGEKISPNRIVFAGDSAGGNMVMTSLCHIKNKGIDLPLPGGSILISPWTSMANFGPSCWQNENKDWILFGLSKPYDVIQTGQLLTDPQLSPLYEKSIKGLPPQLVIWGGQELLRSDIEAWVLKSKLEGVETREYYVEQGQHVFAMGGFMALKKSFNKSSKESADFIVEITKRAIKSEVPVPAIPKSK